MKGWDRMNQIHMNLYKDWLLTVRDVFRGSGQPLPDDMEDDEVALQYFLQNAPYEEARLQRDLNIERFRVIQETMQNHMESLIIPDIRTRTGYTGDQFAFHWVYAQGEHIIEKYSEYRIPLP